jgi:hypothetical protein
MFNPDYAFDDYCGLKILAATLVSQMIGRMIGNCFFEP